MTTPAGPPSKTFTFVAAEDATIDQAKATMNAGSSTTLIADNSPVDDFLLRFNLATSGCTGLTMATLKLTNNANGSTHGVTSTPWDELDRGTVTWANAPARGKLLGSLGAVSAGATYGVEVTTGLSTLNGEVAFRVGSTAGDGAHYYSKEGGTRAEKPQLAVVCS